MASNLSSRGFAAQRGMAALAAMLLFGCSTVLLRTGGHLDGFPEAVQAPEQGGIAAPDVELWIENSSRIRPAEAAALHREATQTLSTALGQHAIDRNAAGASDAVLVVRERGLTRTAERRGDQVAAVVGIVLVGAVVVAAIAAGAKGGGHVAALGRVPIPRGAPLAHAIASAPLAPRGGFAGVPVHAFEWRRARGAHWNLGVIEGDSELDDLSDDLAYDDAPCGSSLEASAPRGEASLEEKAEEPPPPPAPTVLYPAEPAPLDLDRGLFSGDRTNLVFDLFDRTTGVLLWERVAEDNIDPRDQGDINKLVSSALRANPWDHPVAR